MIQPQNQPVQEDNPTDVFVGKIRIIEKQEINDASIMEAISDWVVAHESNSFANAVNTIAIETLCEKEDVGSMTSYDKYGATIHLYVDYIEHRASTIGISVRALTYFLLSHELGHIMSYKVTGQGSDEATQNKYCDMFAVSDMKQYDKDALPLLMKMMSTR